VLLSGSVRVFIQHQDGKEVVLAELQRQDFFGEMGLLDNLPPSASVAALEASEALLVPETVFKQHLMDDPHMTIAIIRALVHRLREADRKIESLALLDVYGRIARLFLDLSKELDGVRVIQQAPPKQEIARQIGASREMVSRVVRHLEESETILVQKRKITLLKAFRVS
jgi:CRP/FNR family cyclic AMP-dependent transcriptional regulator